MTTVTIPPGIDPTGTLEVGPTLVPWLQARQPGEVVEWPDFARYRVERGVTTKLQTGIEHNMNGSQIVAKDDRPFGYVRVTDGVLTDGINLYSPASVFPPSLGKSPSVAPCYVLQRPGIPAHVRGYWVDAHHMKLSQPCTPGIFEFSAFANRGRASWRVDGGSHLIWRNPGCVGSNETAGPNGGYDESIEAQHGWDFVGAVHDFELDHPLIEKVWGDLCYFGRCSSGYVHDGTMRGTGRQGMAFATAADIRVIKNLIQAVRRTMFDFEPPAATNRIDRVLIADNVCGSHRLNFVSGGGNPIAHVGLVEVLRNCLQSSSLNSSMIGGDAAHRRGPYTFADNFSEWPQGGFGAPGNAVMGFDWLLGLTVVRNHQRCQAGRNMRMAKISHSAGFPLDVKANTGLNMVGQVVVVS